MVTNIQYFACMNDIFNISITYKPQQSGIYRRHGWDVSNRSSATSLVTGAFTCNCA